MAEGPIDQVLRRLEQEVEKADRREAAMVARVVAAALRDPGAVAEALDRLAARLEGPASA